MILKKAHILHLVTRIHRVTGCKDLVLVGSGALIAAAKTLPASLMHTGEADVYARDALDPERVEDLIQIHFGQGSQYEKTYKYYADAVSPDTAVLPDDWTARSVRLDVDGTEGLTVTCPSANDLALSKLCAWREKDREWLVTCARFRLIDLAEMKELSVGIGSVQAPTVEEIDRRLAVIAFEILPPGERKTIERVNRGMPSSAATEKKEEPAAGRPKIGGNPPKHSSARSMPDISAPRRARDFGRD